MCFYSLNAYWIWADWFATICIPKGPIVCIFCAWLSQCGWLQELDCLWIKMQANSELKDHFLNDLPVVMVHQPTMSLWTVLLLNRWIVTSWSINLPIPRPWSRDCTTALSLLCRSFAWDMVFQSPGAWKLCWAKLWVNVLCSWWRLIDGQWTVSGGQLIVNDG